VSSNASLAQRYLGIVLVVSLELYIYILARAQRLDEAATHENRHLDLVLHPVDRLLTRINLLLQLFNLVIEDELELLQLLVLLLELINLSFLVTCALVSARGCACTLWTYCLVSGFDILLMSVDFLLQDVYLVVQLLFSAFEYLTHPGGVRQALRLRRAYFDFFVLVLCIFFQH
jgi:hypothetical protein